MKNRNYILIILIIIFVLGINYSLINIISYFEDSKKNKIIDNQLSDYVTIDNNEVKVDLTGLKTINTDTVGYLIVNNTNISYPVVQTTDNDYYLNNNFYKESNRAGWIFLDYKNRLDDNNIVIYGHAMKNKTMFGELEKVLDTNWYSYEDNLYIKLYLDGDIKTYKIFSAYTITNEDYYINTNIKDNELYGFANTLKNRSIISFDTDISDIKQILTLSTCHNNDRFAVHAALQ